MMIRVTRRLVYRGNERAIRSTLWLFFIPVFVWERLNC